MAFEFKLPDIGEGVVEGEVVRWLVKVGDVLREDQPMVEVMTDKATVEIPSPKAGRVLSITAPEGKLCAVGQVMVTIESAGAAPSPTAADGQDDKEEERQFTDGAVAPRPVAPEATRKVAVLPAATMPPPGGKVMASPATRKLARDLGVDLLRVRPSGDNDRVTSEDVRSAAGGTQNSLRVEAPHRAPVVIAAPPEAALAEAPSPTVAATGDERIPFRGVRKKIAENMARSKHTAAHFTYVDECDVTELSALRLRAKKRAEERGIKLSFLPFVIKAVVAGLKKFPIINSTLDEQRGEIVLRRQYHIGVAAASEAGLIVPVVRDADKKTLFEIARELGELSERAKAGKATREELTGSTFTLSSLGALGGLLATPIINFPEVAILGVHKIKSMPVVRDGAIVIREMQNFALSLDHRVVDGYEGARFLAHVLELLADPTLMFMELV